MASLTHIAVVYPCSIGHHRACGNDAVFADGAMPHIAACLCDACERRVAEQGGSAHLAVVANQGVYYLLRVDNLGSVAHLSTCGYAGLCLLLCQLVQLFA